MTKENIQKLQDPLDKRKLLVKTIFGTFILLFLMIALGTIFKDSFLSNGQLFIENYGNPTILISFFIVGFSLIPLPDDAISAFALMAGADIGVIITLASIGSVLGGALGYFLGSSLKSTKWYKKRMEKYEDSSERLIKKYGIWGLALAALTPLPYSPACWICGALKFPKWKFMGILIIFRTIKITYMLWFLKIGLIAF